MKFIDQLKEKAKQNKTTIVLPETSDMRPIEAAGKTGTAQEDLKRPNHALFVGYAPYDNPEISIATRIANGYTSHNAAEVSKKILAYYFKVEDADPLLNGQAENINATSNGVND